MSGFELVPVDGGDPIHLPPGETVLGRGPFLGISDKRVSRLHGLLENLDGQLRLKPTHLNPCFVQSSLSDDPQPLQRNIWHPLHHGDLFSLLPGQFVFRVEAVGGGGGDCTPRNSQMFEEEEELPVSPKPDVELRPPVEQDHGETSALTNQDEAGSSETHLKKVEDKHLSERRRRVLPAWMMAVVAAAHSSSSSPKVQSAGKKKKAAAASTSTKPAAARQVKTSSPEEAELSEEDRPVKRRRKIEDDEEEEEADVPSATVQSRSESIRPEVSDESDSFMMEEKEERDVNDQKPPTPAVSRPESDAKTPRNGRQMTESVGSNGGSASRLALPRVRLRTPCLYGKDCYRKNPLHFQECSHPGDSDYEEEEEEEKEEAADRPECPYGTDCYRKNPLHRKEFKHTEKPASTRRSVQKKAPADDEDEDEDSGDDDSFINDDSEDAGDDSDYVPPDSDDSGKEDVKRLQREAKAFMKKRK